MTQQSNLARFLRAVQSRGLKIDTVYDIGACNGKWTREMKSDVLANATFCMFEGNDIYTNILKSQGHFVHMGVLSNPGREQVEYYNGGDTGDSYYKESTAHYDNKKPIVVKCNTLESVIKENNLPLPNFIKIDTQGSELDVLKGAEEAIKHADLVYLECPIIQYNLGAPGIGEYISFMKQRRFVPMHVLEVHRSEEVLLQIDIMFISENARDKLYGKNVHIKPFA